MNSKAISAIKVAGAIITIAIAAQITIDIGPIPITGQTLAILCWVFFLSPKESFAALLIYLLLGFSGTPIFSDGESGIEKLFGGSGGYLIGFLISGVLVSWLHHRINSTTYLSIFSLTLLGTCIILFFGVARLMMLYGFQQGIAYGFTPFWQGALVKVFLGALIVWGLKRSLSSNPN